MLFKSINTTPIQYFITSKTKLVSPSSVDRFINVKSKNSNSQLRVNNHLSSIPTNFQKGYYQLLKSQKIVGAFGLNYDRTENSLIKDQLQNLSQVESSPLISSFEVSGNQSSNLNQLSDNKNTHWLACLVLSLTCLFFEMILIRIKI